MPELTAICHPKNDSDISDSILFFVFEAKPKNVEFLALAFNYLMIRWLPYFDRGEYRMAMEDFNRALAIDPQTHLLSQYVRETEERMGKAYLPLFNEQRRI